MFKNKATLGNNFHFKDLIPNDLTLGVVYKFQCGLWSESCYGECVRHLNIRNGEHIGGLCNESYYGESVRHLNVRIGEPIRISPLTKKHVKHKNSSVADHLLFCNHSASYDFSILVHKKKKFLLELKESLLIMRDKPSLNRNLTSATLYLFDRA